VRFISLFLLSAGPLLGAGQFTEHTIAADLKGGYQVVAVDINHDGKLDLIALASGMKDLVWFENPTWERHVIASGLPHMINLAAWDIDGDGIPEIAIATEFANEAKKSIGVVSLLKHNGDPRQPWTVTEIDRLTTSHRLRWADIYGNGKKVLVNAPLTGAKAEAPDYRDHVPLVFYRPGEWKREVAGDQNEGVQHGIYIVDWDGSGKDSILTASFSGIDLYQWNNQWSNPWSKNGKWTRTEISKGDPAPWPKGGSSDVAAGRLNGTRFLAAIEPWHGNEIAIYRSARSEWKRTVIDDALVNGHTIVTGDLNGAGRDDVVAGFRGKGHSVWIYSADDEKGTHWTKSVLDDGGMAAAACTVADLNGDGKLDIACIGSATTNLKWYENVSPAQSSAESLHRLFAEFYENQLRENPEMATARGRNEYNNLLRDWSKAAVERRRFQERDILARLQKLSRGALPEQDRLSARILTRELEETLAGEALDTYLLRVFQMYGLHTQIYHAIDQMPSRTAKDYENIVARLNAVPVYVEQNIALLDEAIARGLVQPRIVADLVAGQIASQAAQDAKQTPLLAAFRQFPASISAPERDRLMQAGGAAYDRKFLPAWRKLHTYMVENYAPRARAATALSAMNNGRRDYEFLVRRTTTTNMTPEEIHRLGLKEVERIETAMQATMRQAGFTGTLAEFDRKLNDSPDRHFSSKDEMLAYCRNIAKIVEPQLPLLFKNIPRLLYGIRAIPEDVEAASASNAQAAAPDGSRPGWFNLKHLPAGKAGQVR